MIGQHWGRLGAMATGRTPFDAKVAADNADAVAALAKMSLGAFPAGSDKGDTRAKAEIWGDAAKFKDAMDKNQAEITKVVAAAKSGNADALKSAFGPASGTCKGCHDNFRKD